MIPSAALSQIQIRQFRNCYSSSPVSISDHKSGLLDRLDGFERCFRHAMIVGYVDGAAGTMLIIGIFPLKGFIYEIEAELFRRNPAISLGPHLPMRAKCIQRFLIFP